MLNEVPRLRLAPMDTNTREIAQRGERVDRDARPQVGDRVRVWIMYGRLFGGSIVDGRVAQITPPRPPHRGLGIPIRDHRATVYHIADYVMDGKGFAMHDGAVVSGPDVRSPGPITLDDGEILFLLPRDAAA